MAPDRSARSARSAVLSYMFRPAPARTITSLDPIAIDEWWLLGETEIMEMAKRGVPGVWTYGYYDGWVPNYLFWIALTHNSFGRFYEVQSYGPDVNDNLRLQPTATSREWYPAQSAAAQHQMGTAQQHQHPGIGAADRAA